MCPGPITDLFRAFRNSNIGDVIELWATDPAAKPDVQAWAKRSGNEVVSITDENGYAKIQVRIVKKGIAR
jgi:TusA-related sulfurtransferase